MRQPTKPMTPSLGGGSELVVLAPIKPGFVPSLDAVTYKTRAKLLLKALHSGRKGAHEFQLFRAVSDAAERVGVIHTVRVAVLEPEDKVLLAVNFDGAYESYVRTIWQKASRLLDLIFCNTVRPDDPSQDYPCGWAHSFELWAAWLRSVTVETPFFYARPGLTFQDQQGLRMADRFGRRDADDLAATRIAIPSAERIAWDLVTRSTDPGSGPHADASDNLTGTMGGIRQGLQSLVGLYRLADLYPPGTPDGLVLHRAARELLPEFSRLATEDAGLVDGVASRFQEQLAWLRQDAEPLPATRQAPPLPVTASVPPDAQGGILAPYEVDPTSADARPVSHACLVLVALRDAADAQALLTRLRPLVATTGTPVQLDAPLLNLAFTADGLRACGLADAQLARFAEEFRQGMAARAGLLGDVHGNHPRRWTLPLRNWPQGLDPAWQPADAATAPRVALEALHVLLQVRLVASPAGTPGAPDPQQTIVAMLRRIFSRPDDAAGAPESPWPAGGQPLSLQWMAREDAAGLPVDHFGFADGLSQPGFDKPAGPKVFPNQVHVGEALLGQDNAADRAADQAASNDALLRNGSYLVLRKLRQNVGVLRRAVDAVQPPLPRDLVLAKLMGRWPSDSRVPAAAGLPWPPVPADDRNDFNYRNDPDGRMCPLAAHIRRSNPRQATVLQPGAPGVLAGIPGGRPPRFVRRSLPYGPNPPPWPAPGAGGTPADTDNDDRGLVFMAYNASIAEQFEVMQRWISGGNAAGSLSAQADPFLGVPEAGRRRFFRFEHGGATVRMALDGSDRLGEEPPPIVALQWGAYLFAPSTQGLDLLIDASARPGPAAVPWSAAVGRQEIARLREVERQQGCEAGALAWKAALEDPDALSSFSSASVWAAIRSHHGGVLRIPQGVLVASRALVDQVLLDADKRTTVDGYQQRLRQSIGAIYLGLDDGADGEYQRQSRACNLAIQNIDYAQGFTDGSLATEAALNELIAQARLVAAVEGARSWELNLDSRELIDKVLASLCGTWFGLSDAGGHFQQGGYRWYRGGPGDTGAPLYPGHFNAPSRCTFQPVPGPLVQALAAQQGRPLTDAMTAFLRQQGSSIQAVITRAVLDSTPDIDLAARTLVGALMGFLPTTAGNLRRILAEWTDEGTLLALKAGHDWATVDMASAMALLRTPMARTMQARPVPELIWRTAVQRHSLGQDPDHAVQVDLGDKLILALVSSTQQALESGADGDHPDVFPVFGGARRSDGPSPTHACPGYPAAMGAMLGLLHAILRRTEALRPGPAPGVLSFEGTMSGRGQGGSTAAARPGAAPPPLGRLLAWGDSWIRNKHDQTSDFGDALASLGYATSQFAVLGLEGRTLQQMAAVEPDIGDDSSVFAAIHDALLAATSPIDPQPLPLALLIGGGGNDIHTAGANGVSPLCRMLNQHGSGQPALDPGRLAAFVDGTLAGHLRTVLHRLTRATRGRIPILVHGYDHPIPDNARYPFMRQGWLYPCIHQEHGHPVEPDGRAIMQTLINRLNAMVCTVVAEFEARDRVHHLDLTGTLARQPDFPQGYCAYWLNELHPTVRGFDVLAQVVHTRIQALAAAAQPAPAGP
jgi:hypothetical protein